ncbi:hypothetical protein GCM10023264_19650 [Sphingomonas daechungensis]|uniref:DUF2062 domain-containing protein n=1 Tax=Sphingomonas daechungensis TaxID=1176646 RepID=A0ABX6T207_9SPHN|nr:hypothetical protein [Sphingomonas daechungensis]QNP43897.1 hypothetical protein H9L15_04545 [Sphingomonas daechungensis]
MRHINPTKAGLSVGAVLALWHSMWVAMVAAGWAKAFMNFVLRLHFIQLDYDLAPFAFETAATLVAITFAAGFLFGSVFALIWNWLTAKPEMRDDSTANMSATSNVI